MTGIEDIKGIRPHRHPFLLVDRVISVDAENNSTVCLKNVSSNESRFNGQFPQPPIMPGVLIIEAMAQAVGIPGFQVKGRETVNDQTIYYFVGADNECFCGPLVPGDQLILKARLLALKRNIWKFACESVVDGNIACSAEVTCARKVMQS